MDNSMHMAGNLESDIISSLGGFGIVLLMDVLGKGMFRCEPNWVEIVSL